MVFFVVFVVIITVFVMIHYHYYQHRHIYQTMSPIQHILESLG